MLLLNSRLHLHVGREQTCHDLESCHENLDAKRSSKRQVLCQQLMASKLAPNTLKTMASQSIVLSLVIFGLLRSDTNRPVALSWMLIPPSIKTWANSSLPYAMARCNPVVPEIHEICLFPISVPMRGYLPRYSSPSTLSMTRRGKHLRRSRAILV